MNLISPANGQRQLLALTDPSTGANCPQSQVMDFPTTWALGYSPARLGSTQPRPGSTFGMIGSNGTAAYVDTDSGIAVAVMRNHVAADYSVVAAIDDIIAAAHG